jgi:hypothetical protein
VSLTRKLAPQSQALVRERPERSPRPTRGVDPSAARQSGIDGPADCFSMIAEQRQRAIPNQDLKVVSPWMAVEINSGTSGDGKIVALIFQTTEGVPIEVAMSPEIARETFALLSRCSGAVGCSSGLALASSQRGFETMPVGVRGRDADLWAHHCITTIRRRSIWSILTRIRFPQCGQ